MAAAAQAAGPGARREGADDANHMGDVFGRPPLRREDFEHLKISKGVYNRATRRAGRRRR